MEKGSIVICEGGGNWYDITTNEDAIGPSIGEILTVSGFQSSKLFLEFEEYPALQYDGLPAAYHIIYFRELQPPMTIKLEELISEPQTT